MKDKDMLIMTKVCVTIVFHLIICQSNFCLHHSREVPFFGGLHALTVDDPNAWTGIATAFLADIEQQQVVYVLSSAIAV